MKGIPQIFFMQTFGILLVVFGHSFYLFSPDNPILQWIYAFHMPLFFFISGYLLHYTHPQTNQVVLSGRKGYLTRRARRLLLPYVVISSLVFVPKALMSQYSVRPVQLTWHDYIDNLIYPFHNVMAAYWFMPTLFLIMFLFMMVARLGLCKYRYIVLGASLLLYAFVDYGFDSLLNIRGVCHFFIFFVAGYYFHQSRAEQLFHNCPLWKTLTTTILLSLLACPPLQSVWMNLFTAFNGIALSLCLAQAYERSRLTFLNHLYGATYYIYLFSGFFQILVLQVLLHFVHLPAIAFIPLATLFGVYGPWAMYRFWKGKRSMNVIRNVNVLCLTIIILNLSYNALRDR